MSFLVCLRFDEVERRRLLDLDLLLLLAGLLCDDDLLAAIARTPLENFRQLVVNDELEVHAPVADAHSKPDEKHRCPGCNLCPR